MADYLTAALPGTGGEIRQVPEDFRVTEIPLYSPCGKGEHLYLEVEKKGLSTFEMIHRLARALELRERDFGYAGLKDARATTRQTVSITGVDPDRALALQIEGLSILSARFHRNKLRLGHLAGNRFTIRLRGVAAGALEPALDILHVLQEMGVPNRFGSQRYGVLDNSHRIGASILRGRFAEAALEIVGDPQRIENPRWREAAERFRAGDLDGALEVLPPRQRHERQLMRALAAGKPEKEAVLGLPRKLLRLYLSAFQSHLFDRLVTMRLDTIDRLWTGDLAFKHDNGACFTVTDAAQEQPRADRLEISPSAPLYGHKVQLAGGQAGILEEALLEKEGLRAPDFRLERGLAMAGERRPLRVPLTDVEAATDADGLLLSFGLPRGSYATSVLREVLKNDPA